MDDVVGSFAVIFDEHVNLLSRPLQCSYLLPALIYDSLSQ